jgi:hypothetical protein
MIGIHQRESHEFTVGIHNDIVSIAKLVSIGEPVFVYSVFHKGSGVPSRAVIQKFIGSVNGIIVH